VPVVAELTSADCQTAETVAGGPAETAELLWLLVALSSLEWLEVLLLSRWLVELLLVELCREGARLRGREGG